MRVALRVLGLAFLGLGLACGGGGGGGAGDGGFGDLADGQSNEVTVIFENRQYTDCTIYYHGSGGRRRLGRVIGNSTGHFSAPDSPAGFVITAAYQAVGDISTQRIQASPGQTVTITSHTTGNLTFTIR